MKRLLKENPTTPIILPASLVLIHDIWISEIHEHCPGKLIV